MCIKLSQITADSWQDKNFALPRICRLTSMHNESKMSIQGHANYVLVFIASLQAELYRMSLNTPTFEQPQKKKQINFCSTFINFAYW